MRRTLFAVLAALCTPLAAPAAPAVPLDDLPELVLAQAPDVAVGAVQDLVVSQAPEVAPSVLQSALDWLLSPGGLVAAVGGILTVLALLLGPSAVRRRRVALAIYHGYQIMNDVDAERGDHKLDKVVGGLKAADDWMKAHGWRPLKPGEQATAKLGFKSLHGAEKQRVKVAAEAHVLAAAKIAATVPAGISNARLP